MKRALLYFLLFIFLWCNTALGEILKAPFLVTHYLEHRRLDTELTVMGFLSMHYWGNDLKDYAANQDLKLPFKKILNGNHHILFKSNDKTKVSINHIHQVWLNNRYTNIYLTGSHLDRLYRPPRAKTVFSA